LGALQIVAKSKYFCRQKTDKIMTKEEYLELAGSRCDEQEKLKEKDNFYDYGKGFDEIWQDLGREYIESSMNEASATNDRRKKTLTRYGEISILKSNCCLQGKKHGFGISPYMQE
jgi:hypothetical protein